MNTHNSHFFLCFFISLEPGGLSGPAHLSWQLLTAGRVPRPLRTSTNSSCPWPCCACCMPFLLQRHIPGAAFPKKPRISLLERHVQLLNESSGYRAPCMGTRCSLSLGFFTNQSDFVIKQVLHGHCHQLGASLAHLRFRQRHKDLGASKLCLIKRDDVFCCSLLRCLNYLCGR